ncbi:MAG: Calx-beta domain-containing protein [Planctomycetota bacterium]
MGNKLYFGSSEPGSKLYWIDTTKSPWVVESMVIDAGESFARFLGNFQAAGDKLYFTAERAKEGVELFWIDTTLDSPVANAIDVEDGAEDSLPELGLLEGNRLYFTADINDREKLHWIDVTENSPSVQTITLPDANYTVQSQAFRHGNKLFFLVNEGFDGRQLYWIDPESDSLAANRVKPLGGSTHSTSFPNRFGTLGPFLFFEARTSLEGHELYWLDASSSEPMLETVDYVEGPLSGAAFDLFGFHTFGESLLFSSSTVAYGTELHELRFDESVVSPSLSVTIDKPSISEDGDLATVTVTRSVVSASSLDVFLASSDTSELNPTASVTIPAGEASVEFTIAAEDDRVFDGDVDVELLLSATLYVPATQQVTVADNEIGFFELVIDADSIDEKGGSTEATLTRSTDNSELLVVELTTDLPDELAVPESVTIPAGSSSTRFTINAIDNSVAEGDRLAAVEANAPLIGTGSDNVIIVEDEPLFLTLNIARDAVSENGGTSSVTVNRNSVTDRELVVLLASEDTDEATVPASVTIPVGSTSASFTLTGVDENFVDGTRVVTINASATNHDSASDSVEVTDNDVPTLGLSLDPESILENGGTSTVTVTRNTDTSTELLVNLRSEDTTEATVPATMIMPVGASSATVTLHAVDDDVFDGTQRVAIRVSASSFVGTVRTLSVRDDERNSLFLTIDEGSISENGGESAATVERNSDTTFSLQVFVYTSDATEAIVPSPIRIPAGASSTNFTISGVDDTFVDGTQPVTFSVSAVSHFGASASLEVTDDDVPTLTLELDDNSISENGGSTTATLSRNIAPDDELAVALTNPNPAEASFPASVVIPAGATSVQFTISGVDDDVVDDDKTVIITGSAANYVDASAAIDITNDDVPTVQLHVDSLIMSENEVVTATVTRNTQPSGNLVVSLSSFDAGEATVPSSVTIPAGVLSAEFAITGVDDHFVDGTNPTFVTATADNHGGSSLRMEVTDANVPTLLLQNGRDSIPEDGETIAVRVERNTDLNVDLVVELFSSDATEATVPETVTIPAGSWATNFTVTPQADFFVDGDQTVEIRAKEASHADGIDTIEVTDVDIAKLTLVIAEDEIAEQGGSSSATVSRNTDTSVNLVVSLSSTDVSEAIVPATVTIPAGAFFTTFQVEGQDDPIVDGTQSVFIFADAEGHGSSAGEIAVTDEDSPILTMQIDESSIGENGGVSTATVTRNTNTDSALLVSLQSSDSSEATVPSQVTIPAGFYSVEFNITGQDDLISDGTQSVQVTATATDHASTSASIDVTDDDSSALTVSINESFISENGGSAIGTVSRNTSTGTSLVVSLASSDPSEATVQEQIIISQGASSVDFIIHAQDDSLVDEFQFVTITASADDHAAGNASLWVDDDDTPALELVISERSIAEAGGVSSATLSRNTDNTSAIIVGIRSLDKGEAIAPENVTIPAGASSTTFDIHALQDGFVDGSQNVEILATLLGFTDGTDRLNVTDSDVPELSLTYSSTELSENGGVITATIQRNTAPNGALLVFLNSDDPDEAGVPSSVVFSDGESSVDFAITGQDDAILDGTQSVHITANAAGFAATEATFDVLDDEVPEVRLTLQEDSISENGGTTIATLIRNTSTANPLVVSLSSTDPAEAAVPESITIPAGATSVIFTIEAQNEELVDGNKTVDISASAADHASSSAALEITDDDVAMLLLEIDEDSIAENGGSTTARIRRNTDPTQPLIVSIASSDPGEAVVPARLVIPSGAFEASFTISGQDEGFVDGPQDASITVTADGHTADASLVTVTDDDIPILVLGITQTEFSENGGSVTATVTRNTPTSTQLQVSLRSNLPDEASVPSHVFIPQGERSASFAISGMDEGFVDGTQSVEISVSAGSYIGDSGIVSVTDDDIPVLTLTLNGDSISENESTTATITRNTSTTSELEVLLASSALESVTVPNSVIIAAGSSSTEFNIAGVLDYFVDGDETVLLSASADGFVLGEDRLEVTDFDQPLLELTIESANVDENGGLAQATITRNTPTDSELLVDLLSSEPTEATVPASVTFPIGASSVSFVIAGQDEILVDGTQSVEIGVAAEGFTGATDSINVLDDDVPTLFITAGQDSISESEYTFLTVSKNTRTDDTLIVSIDSSDEGELEVVETLDLTNVNSRGFTIWGLSDSLVDGTQLVQVTASTQNYVSAAYTIEVTDVDVPTLALRLNHSSLSENGVPTTGTVTRNTATDVEQLVFLTSTDPSEAIVQESVVIPVGATSAQFPVSPQDDLIADGSQQLQILVGADGFMDDSANLRVNDDDSKRVFLSIDADEISENGGMTTGTVSRNSIPNEDLVVSLLPSDASNANIPASVTIPAGETSVDFTITGENDDLAYGTQSMTIRADADQHIGETQSLDILDDEEPTLTVEIDAATIDENGGSATVTIARNTPTESQLQILLSATPDAQIEIPATLIIPENESSRSFTIVAIDNQLVADNSPVQILANHPEFVSGSASINIRNDDIWTWTNPANPLDINDDGFVSAIDALVVINHLNTQPPGRLDPPTEEPEFFVDVSGDSFVTAIDALLVIDRLNSRNGEGESQTNHDAMLVGLLESEFLRMRNSLAIDGFFAAYGARR